MTKRKKRRPATKRKRTRSHKHVCETCGKKFTTGTAYDRHQSKAHGVMSFRGKRKHRYTCGHCSHISHSRRESDAHRRSHGLEPHKRVRKDTRSSERKAETFFLKNAGGVVGKRREGAKALAHAEAEAARRGWRVSWDYSPDAYEMGDAETEHPSEVLDAVLKDESGSVLASLGQIGDPSSSYKRVVEAELALEALGSV